mgnify:CR=1 FL=1
MSKKSHHPFSKGRQFKLLGLSKQDCIKYFFGGNAALAIIIIIGIVVFLGFNAFNFFPKYKDSLNLYRKSGQEFVDHSVKQYNSVFELKGLCTQARAYEIEERVGPLYRVVSVHGEFKSKAIKQASTERKELKRVESAFKSLTASKDADSAKLKQAQDKLDTAREALRKKLTSLLNNIDYDDLTIQSWATDEKYLEPIRASVVENIITGKKTAFIKEIEAEEKIKVAEITALPQMQALQKAYEAFNTPLFAMEGYTQPLADKASKIKAQGEKYETVVATKAALNQALKIANTPEKRAKAELDLKRLLDEEPNYDILTKPFYESIDDHQKVYLPLVEQVKLGMSLVPFDAEFQAVVSRDQISDIKEIQTDIYQALADERANIENWDHSKEYTIGDAMTGFFFGTEWITNSSWQDFYGILPLLAGSVFVAVLAICIAVPFSVGGAIYVNRIATKTEQTIIKPFIEFIQAIPSIVLAFFGYVVLGGLIQKYSQSDWLNWIPGFPAEGPYNILTAGLLLALMAVPTIFTLCEDALNNVPKSYKEASLALGSTNLQSVLKVILPSCASGIIAAILLGFGRIIGETMVVLLVLGGRIAIPTSFTDPAHSMTGILAQEIGEVDKYSLHWGALFMVGCGLFFIALTLNFVSQKILKKYSN